MITPNQAEGTKLHHNGCHPRESWDDKTIALIVAAGSGLRLGNSETPKQYLKLNGRSILPITIEKFASHPLVDAVAVVIGAGHQQMYEAAVSEMTEQLTSKLLPPVVGGPRRQDSVRLGLNALQQHNPKLVLIHDAARIFIQAEQITQLVQALTNEQAAALGARATDTLWDTSGSIFRNLPRDGLFQIQTPQGFHYELIRQLHNDHQDQTVTDDLGLLEYASIKSFRIIESLIENFKITTKADLKLAENLLSART